MSARKNKRYRMRLMGMRVVCNLVTPGWLPDGLTKAMRAIEQDFARVKLYFDEVLP